MKPLSPTGPTASAEAVAAAFDAGRLRQARQLALKTKQDVAAAIGVSPAAVGQYESGSFAPRPEHIEKLATFLRVPVGYFAAGRPQARLESAGVFFRSLRATAAKQRNKAISYAEHVWELANALESHVRFPPVDIPGFAGGEIAPGTFSTDPATAAQQLRAAWSLGDGPIPQMLRLVEAKGIITVLVPMVETEVARIDAFSTTSLGRPLMILSPDRADDVYRHRFSIAHELGHIILHGGRTSGTLDLEREADRFAAEFLTPARMLDAELESRLDMNHVLTMSNRWGVQPSSIVLRSRELGKISEASARRGYIRLHQMAVTVEPVAKFPGEQPLLLSRAVELASEVGITIPTLAAELAWTPAHLRLMLGESDTRPQLSIVP
ncbi:Zn-dependent peptidase ImmA (M78 family)/transcriptional regulator with XRE-family HTH domain [Microbacterium phyllosphaerae]|uniref:Zn-dependent peptidase ImmA (M78 family)/transcriptional regulator with XRE-family HTH domain n=1 Tax=Microbacterium phyllosphaerae TaxID=124798 RepID=A0ABS4WL06_9MICO|nr:XRE family transcriptional regulator [Microbacterium phyllosphaerae]MBP2376894.1 Zn-dependent peptidase ImmA (M78 family)/transcriptional regulator with XRE-family HTH domain [Microbacterium phyllosphaerae]